jgi:hypothetical protein
MPPSSGATRFRLGPYTVQFVYKWRLPKPRSPISPFCRWHVYICNRPQWELRCHKPAMKA